MKKPRVKAYITKDNEKFRHYLLKKKERLIILLDTNLENKRDPSEDDIIFLEEEYELFDRSAVTWSDTVEKKEQSVSQLSLKTEEESDK